MKLSYLFLKLFRKKERKASNVYKLGGAKKDKPDRRDYLAKLSSELPKRVMLKEYCPEIRNQGKMGSCTAHAAVSLVEIERNIAGEYYIEGSELYNYYYSRLLGGFYPKDSGAYLRDAMKVLLEYGFCPEKLMPYDDTAIAIKPGIFCDSFADMFKIKAYFRCYTVNEIKTAVNSKHPVAFSCPMYNTILSQENIMYLPSGISKGGHAMTIVGYDDDMNAFYVRNWWTTSWANQGYVWMPYEYLMKVPWFDAWYINYK